MLFPSVAYEEVRGLHGEVRQFTDMGRISLGTSLHIVGLKVVDVDALVVEHTVETVNCKLLVDTIDSGLNVFFTLVEVVSVDGTQ